MYFFLFRKMGGGNGGGGIGSIFSVGSSRAKVVEEGKIKRNIGVYYERIETLLNEIWEDLEGNILIKNLEEFLKNDKSIIIKRLSLIKLIIEHFDPNETFESLKNIIDKINQRWMNKKKCTKIFHNPDIDNYKLLLCSKNYSEIPLISQA